MFGRIIEATLRFNAQDKTGPAWRSLARGYTDVGRRAAAFNRQQSAIYKTGMAASRAANATLMRYGGPAAIAYGATKAYTATVNLDRRLTQIGITAGASAGEMEAAMGKIYRIADDVGTPVENVIQQLETLVATGRTLDEAVAQLPLLSKVAETYAADYNDLGITFDVLGGSLGIVGDQAKAAMDIIAAGGKEGKFELKDMAAELPSMVPAFAALGYSGLDGLAKLTALLQIVRKDTGTSAEAATELNDVFQKMESLTVFNNFKRFGIDIRKELKRARDNGEDLIDAFIRLSIEAIHGDLSKLPQLFTDKQMLGGMRSLINHFDDLGLLTDKFGDSLGTVDEDFKRLADDGVASINRMKNAWTELQQEVGGIFAPAVTRDLNATNAIIKALREQGMGGMDIVNWFADNIGNQEARRLMALRGGYRPEPSEGFMPELTMEGMVIPRMNLRDTDSRIATPIPRPGSNSFPPFVRAPVRIPPPFRLPSGSPGYGLDPDTNDLYNPINEQMKSGFSINRLEEAERKLNIGSENIAKGGTEAGKAMEQGGKAAADALNEAADALRRAADAAIRSAAQERSLGRDVAGPGDL